MAKCLSEELIDLRMEYRERMDEMQECIDQKVADSAEVLTRLKEYKDFVDFFSDRYDEDEEWKSKVMKADKEKVKAMNKLMERMDKCEEADRKHEEEFNIIERKRR